MTLMQRVRREIKGLTSFEKSPVLQTLVRLNKWGVGSVMEANQDYDYAMLNEENPTKKALYEFTEMPVKVANILAYPMGILEVLFGVRSEKYLPNYGGSQ